MSQEETVWIDTDDFAALTGWAKSTIEGKRSRAKTCRRAIGRSAHLYKLSEVNSWIESKRRIPSSVQLAQETGA